MSPQMTDYEAELQRLRNALDGFSTGRTYRRLEADVEKWRTDCWEARRRANIAEAAIKRAKECHPCDDSNPRGSWCPTCLTAWPCPTIAALESLTTPESFAERLSGPSEAPAVRGEAGEAQEG